MNKLNYFKFILLSLLQIIIPLLNICKGASIKETDTIKIKHYNLTESLLTFASKNNIKISEKIRLVASSQNNKYFLSTEDIEVNETLLEIPYDILLSPKKIEQEGPEKLKFIYKEIFNSSEDNPINKILRVIEVKEQAFLAISHYYILKNKKESAKLYKKYKKYFDSYEDNLDNLPLFYSQDELDILHNTQFYRQLKSAKESLELEIDYFTKNLSMSYIIPDEYMKYRALIVKKCYALNFSSHLVPFGDFFNLTLDEKRAHTRWENNDKLRIFRIFSINKINKNTRLIMLAPQLSNSDYLMYHGVTFENNINVNANPFVIDIIDRKWDKEEQKKIANMKLPEYYVNINEESFIGDSIETYRIAGMALGLPKNDDTGYWLMLKNLKLVYENYNIDEKEYYKKIIYDINRLNIKRVIEYEKKFIERRIELLESIVKGRNIKYDL